MSLKEQRSRFRIRYSETDQMGTFYNSRVLEWFEIGRGEYLRAVGKPYAQIEESGLFLPLVEMHAALKGRAKYDDLLEIVTTGSMSGRARVRFDMVISHVEGGAKVAEGYTVHAVTARTGKPVRPPDWLIEAMAETE